MDAIATANRLLIHLYDWVAYLLAALLIVAVAGKASAMGEFFASIDRLKFLPRGVRTPMPLAVPISEIICIGLILIAATRQIGLYMTLSLLAVFTAYLMWRVLHPDGFTCACFGNVMRFPFLNGDRVSLARNAILLTLGTVGLLSRRWNLSDTAPHHPTGLSAANSINRSASRGAFTLVEMMVVIGLIGILIAFLLPALARARAAGKLVACQSQLREVGQLAFAWQASADGHVPLDGFVFVPSSTAGPGSLQAALQDPTRAHYAYTPDKYPPVVTSYGPPTLESPTPFLVALLQFASRGVLPDYQTQSWSAITRNTQIANLIHCPSNDSRTESDRVWSEGSPSSYLVIGDLAYASPWRITSDYKTNGAALGFHFDRAFDRFFLRGRLAAVRHPARTALAMDAGSSGLLAITPAFGAAPPAGTTTLASPLHADSGKIDILRHRGKCNVLFVDGHVDSITGDTLSLQRVELSE